MKLLTLSLMLGSIALTSLNGMENEENEKSIKDKVTFVNDNKHTLKDLYRRLGFSPSNEKPIESEFYLNRYNFKKEYSYMNPNEGLLFSKFILEQMRLSGNYGHINNKKLFRPGANLSMDAPHDSMAIFLQFLFPHHWDLNLTTNPYDFVKKLNPEEIAKIITIIHPYHGANKETKKNIVNELIKLLNVKDESQLISNNEKITNRKLKKQLKERLKKELENNLINHKEFIFALKALYKSIKGDDINDKNIKIFIKEYLSGKFHKDIKKNEKLKKNEKIKNALKKISNIEKVVKKELSEKHDKRSVNMNQSHDLALKLLSDDWLVPSIEYISNLLTLNNKEYKDNKTTEEKKKLKKKLNEKRKLIDRLRRPYYFLGSLLKALDEEGREDSIYNKRDVAKSLMSVLLLKSDDNLKSVSKILSDFMESNVQKKFPLTKTNYFLFKESVENAYKSDKAYNLKKNISYILNQDPEFSLFVKLGALMYEQKLPENLYPIEVNVFWDKKNREFLGKKPTSDRNIESKNQYTSIKYSNCGSTSLNNFLNIILFDPKKHEFDISHLIELEAFKDSAHMQKIIKYYKEHTTPSSQKSINAQNEFAAILCGLPNVSYHKGNGETDGKKVAEITSGLKNMLNVIKSLAPSFYKGKTVEKDGFTILNKFTNTLKLPNLDIEWDFDDQEIWSSEKKQFDFEKNNMGIANIPIIIGDEEIFWNFENGHFSLKYEYDKIEWQKDFGKILYNLNGSKNFIDNNSLNIHLDFLGKDVSKAWDENPNNFWKSVWFANLDSDTVLKKAITSYARLREKEGFHKKYTVFLKWISKLSLTDDFIKFFLFKEADKYPEILKIKGKIPDNNKTIGELIESFSDDYKWARGYSHLLNRLGKRESKLFISNFKEKFSKIKDIKEITKTIALLFTDNMPYPAYNDMINAISSGKFKDKESIAEFVNCVKENKEILLPEVIGIDINTYIDYSEIILSLIGRGFKDKISIDNLVKDISKNKEQLLPEGISAKNHYDIVSSIIKYGFNEGEINDFNKEINDHKKYLFPKGINANNRAEIINALINNAFVENKYNDKYIAEFTNGIKENEEFLFIRNMDLKYRINIIKSLINKFKSKESITEFAISIIENKQFLFPIDTDDEDISNTISALAKSRFFKSDSINKFVNTMKKNEYQLFTRYSIKGKYRSNIINALAIGNLESIDEFVKAINDNEKHLFIKGISSEGISKIITDLAKIRLKDKSVIEKISKNLFTKNMDVSCRSKIIAAITKSVFIAKEHIDKEYIEEFADSINENKELLFKKNMNGEDVSNIISTMAEEGYKNKSIVKAIATLFQEGMNSFHCCELVKIASYILNEKEYIIELAIGVNENKEKLFTKDMRGYNHRQIIMAIANCCHNDRNDISLIAEKFEENMNVSTRLDIIYEYNSKKNKLLNILQG